MEMDNSLLNSMNELINLQRQQLSGIQDLTLKQAEQLNLQRQQNSQTEQQRFSQRPNSFNQYNPGPQQYMPGTFDLTQNVHAQANQFAANMRNLTSAGSGYGFVDTFFSKNGYSPEMKSSMALDYAGRASAATLSGTGAALSAGLSLGSMLIPGIGLGGSIAMGMGGSALAGAYFDNAAEQSKIQSAYTKYLQRESYRFINSSESNNDRGYTGFSLRESQKAANFLRTVNSDFHITNDDMSKLLQNYTESGLLRDVGDLESFKDKIKSLTKNVKTGATLLNETYGSISDLISEMKKMNINEGSYNSIMSAGKLIGSDLGISGSEATRNILSIAGGFTNGTSLSNDVYTGRISDTMIYANSMYNSLKTSTNLNSKQQAALNYIMNNGGVQGVTSTINQIQDSLMSKYNNVAAAFYDYDSGSNTWAFNSDKYNNLVTGVKTGQYQTLNDLYDLGTSNLEKYGNLAIKDWQDNGHLYMGNTLDQTQISDFTKSVLISQNRLIGASDGDLDTSLSLSLDGLSADQRALYSNYLNEFTSTGSGLITRQNVLAGLQQMGADRAASSPGPLSEIKYAFEDLKESLGGIGASASDQFGKWGQGINDALYGKYYTNMDFNTKTDWSISGMQKINSDFYDIFGKMQKSLSGMGADQDMIDAFSIGTPDGLKKYRYNREVYTDPSELTGTVKDYYNSIQSEGDDHGLSETILSALVKFSNRTEGQKLFGADKSTYELLSKTDQAAYNAAGNDIDTQLKYAAQALESLVGMYGGNQDLAMKAFYGGYQSVDAQLVAMGYDVNALRNSGQQGLLGNVDASGVVINNTNYTGWSGVMTNEGVDASDLGIHYAVEGTGVDPSLQYAYLKDYNYQKGGKADQNGDKYYDAIQLIGGQLEFSPAAIASVMATESSGHQYNSDGSIKRGGSGEVGMMQVIPTEGRWDKYKGKSIDLGNGKSYVIGTNASSAGITDPQLAMEYELRDEMVNLYVGTQEYSDFMDAATTDGKLNPYLGYAAYNGGAGATASLRRYVMSKGWTEDQYNNMTPAQLMEQLRMNGQGQIADHIKSFAAYYDKGIVSPTSVTGESYETVADTKTLNMIKSAMTNAQITEADIMGSTGYRNPVDIDFIDSVRNKYNDALATRAGYKSATMGGDPLAAMMLWGKDAYTNDVVASDYGDSNLYLDDTMQKQFLSGFSGGIDLTTYSGADKSDIFANSKLKAKQWYDTNYANIIGNTQDWQNLSTSEKIQMLETMSFMGQSNIGLDLSGDIGASDSWEKYFSEKDKNYIYRVDENGEMGANKLSGNWVGQYTNAKKWANYGSSYQETLFDLPVEGGVFQKSVNQVRGMFAENRDKMINGIASGKMYIPAGQDVSMMMPSEYDAAIKKLDDMLLRSDDVAHLGQVVSSLFLGGDEGKDFLKSMDYDTLSSKDKLGELSINDLEDVFNSGYEKVLGKMTDQLEEDLPGVMKQLSTYFTQDDLMNENVLGKYLSVDSDGVYSIKGGIDAEKLAEQLLTVFTASGLDPESSPDGTTGADTSALSESSEGLSKAITDFSAAMDKNTTTITSSITTMNNKINAMSDVINGTKVTKLNPFVNWTP